MVMHARKLPRLSDGYFDRTQAHPYENSSKYSSKSNLGSRYNDKVRESPSNGSHSRMGSPDSRHSPRYHKSSYNQRLKDRDKDHERGAYAHLQAGYVYGPWNNQRVRLTLASRTASVCSMTTECVLPFCKGCTLLGFRNVSKPDEFMIEKKFTPTCHNK
uniref:Uncharacterized protein n=1 Tax=Rhipicephalus pulchellus TaxID=72859 RepID=L7LY38_RHIPC